MVEINWTKDAIEDANQIAIFISQSSSKYARIQIERFFERTIILETFPKSGRIVPEINDLKIRELIIGNYRIIYKIVSKKSIDILTIHLSQRLLKNNPNIKK